MNEVQAFRELLPQITADNFEQIESDLLSLPQVACDVIHRFGPGLYIREVFIPAGTFAIGHWQKFAHMNVFLKGAVLIVKDDGTTQELRAPMSFVGRPGRKIGYIIEDMYWQNIYATDEQDIETLESMYFDKDAVVTAHKAQKLAFERLQKDADRADYAQVLQEIGMAQSQVDEQVNNEFDRINLPLDSYKIMVSDSPIEGKGLFATAPIKEGDIIAPARLAGKRTQAGRFTNHARHPNAMMVAHPSGDIYLVASKAIQGLHGGEPAEEITVDYRQSINECLLASQVNICRQ